MARAEHHELESARAVGAGAQRDASSELQRAHFVYIDTDRCEEVCDLEQICYPTPWSRELIRGEFAKEISFRPGVQLGSDLIAYSFNYLLTEELHILNVAVHPAYRGLGCARNLLSFVLVQAAKRGATYATLEVRQSNEVARRLYAKLGFSVVGVRRRYYRDTGEDAFVLERTLSVETLKPLERTLRFGAKS